MKISIAYYIKLNIFLNEIIFSYVVFKFDLYSESSFRLFLNFVCIRNLNVYYNFTKNWHILLYINSFSISRIQCEYKPLKLLLHLKFQYFCIKLNVFVY